jgi:hypothetical protein
VNDRVCSPVKPGLGAKTAAGRRFLRAVARRRLG